MMFCRECGKSIHETAINCPQCGAPQGTSTHVNKNDSGTLWLPVPALICGIFAFLAIFDDSSWDEDAYMGMFIFSSVAVILGTIGSANQQKGRGMSIAGIILGVFGALGLLEKIFN